MEILRIVSGNAELNIDAENGVITRLYGNGRNLCENNGYPLFVLSVIKPNYENVKIPSSDFLYKSTEVDGNTYAITYLYKDEYTVRLKVTADPETDEFRFRADVQNRTDALIEWLEYPGVSWKDDLDGSKRSNILWMFNEGSLVSYNKDKMWPYEDPKYPSWGSFGVFPNMIESQFLAYLYDGGGLYVGCHDDKANVKQIDFYHKDERIKLQLRFYSGVDYGEDFSLSFDVVFRFFRGEWRDACDIYREWFEKNTTVKRICENDSLPTWYKEESPLVVALPVLGAHDTAEMKPNKLYPYDNLLREVERIAEKTKSKLLVLLMQWEGTAPWAPPYVWPPYGGEENFVRFAEKLHAMGHYLGLYCSGFAWTQQSRTLPSYNREKEFAERHLEREMCVGPDQKLEYRTVCTPQMRGYDFCAKSAVLKDIMAQEVGHMLDAGADYIQLLDQNHGGCSYFCYSKSHGHPPVPGKWQAEAVNDRLCYVKRDKNLFGCESAAAEPFLENLSLSDNRWTLAELVGDPVPAYAYIYHSRVNNFMGNQTCCEIKYDENDFCYREAYSFLAGDLLTIVIDEDGEIMHHWGAARKGVKKPDQATGFEFVKNINRWRVAAKEYLVYGDMVKPLAYKADGECVFTVFRRRDFEKRVPKVMSNAFAFNGKRADVFVNYTREEVAIYLPKEPDEKLYMSAEDFEKGIYTERDDEKIVVPPLSAILMENPIKKEALVF